VNVQRLAIIVERYRVNRTDSYRPGIVYQNIYIAEPLPDLVQHCLHTLLVREVTLETIGLKATRPQVLYSTVEFLLVASTDGQSRPSLAELARQDQAQTPGPAGNDNGFVA
jgi:hypothetical protein